MSNLKPKPLAHDLLQLGYKASRSIKFPASGCVIRSFKGHHHDVFIKRRRSEILKSDFMIL